MGKPAVSESLANALRLADESRALADSIQLRVFPIQEVAIRQLIDSEISDFVAALGCPGFCETPQAIQAELLKRFACILAFVDLRTAGLGEDEIIARLGDAE